MRLHQLLTWPRKALTLDFERQQGTEVPAVNAWFVGNECIHAQQ